MGNVRRASALAVLAIVGLGLASLDTPRRTSVPFRFPGSRFASPYDSFFIGAWVGPRSSRADPEEWRRFRDAGLTVSFRGLEDPNDRAANLKTLALLDSLGLAMLPRDDSVHPDEMARPGWRDRVREVVAAYHGHRSNHAYFLADEPRGALLDSVANVAAAFAEADPARSAYVNVLPTYENSSEATQARWRDATIRLIRRGRLRLWSWAAYSQRSWGEDATFLLTQRNALEVGKATGVPGAAVLQFSGFAELDPLPKAQLDYLAAESIAHGARGLVWFTWWTPNPAGPEGPWRGGAVEYDGTPSSRADTLATVNRRARALARAFPNPLARNAWLRVAHFGSPMPKGSFVPSDRIPGLRAVDGGPATVAASERGDGARWLVINRDRARRRTVTLLLQPSVGVVNILEPDSAKAHPFDSARRSVLLALEPGGSAVLGIVPR